ncbi:MAG: hypothetical protein RL497_474 [Pseudomonadota bacterium]|jgi:hypothetical protein
MASYEDFLAEELKRIGSLESRNTAIGESITIYHRRIKEETFVRLDGLIGTLELELIEKSLITAFAHHDFPSAMNSFYYSLLARIIRLHNTPRGTSACAAGMKDVLLALLVNNKTLLHWMSQYYLPFFEQIGGRAWYQKPYTYHHLCLMVRLALQQDWPLLAHFCREALAAPVPSKNKSYVTDYRFFMALATQDEALLQQHFAEIAKPKFFLKRQTSDFGEWSILGSYMACYPMLYFKLAQMAGYALTPPSIPWFPEALLPPTPAFIPRYEGLEFLEAFDLFKPFDDGLYPSLPYSLVPLTPRPIGQPPVTFVQVQHAIKGAETLK